jgi:hypothetical protein
MDFGTLGHLLLLGKGGNVDIGDFDDWRTKAAQAFRDESKLCGRTPVLKKTYEEGLVLKEGALREFRRLGVLEDFEKASKEHTFIWRDDASYLRCMIDAAHIDKGAAIATVMDLKITHDASPEACIRRIGEMGYDLQAHFQMEAVKSVGKENGLHVEGRTKHLFLFIEDEFPHMVCPIELSAECLHNGRQKFNMALHRWKDCMATGSWPGYSAGVVVAEAMPWDTKRVEQMMGLA